MIPAGCADLTITLATERACTPMLLNQAVSPLGWLPTPNYSTQFPVGAVGSSPQTLCAYRAFPADELTWPHAPPAAAFWRACGGELLIARVDAGAPIAAARP